MQKKIGLGPLVTAAFLSFVPPSFAQTGSQQSLPDNAEVDGRVQAALEQLCTGLAEDYAKNPEKTPFSAVAISCLAAAGDDSQKREQLIGTLQQLHDTVCLRAAMIYSENPKARLARSIVAACQVS